MREKSEGTKEKWEAGLERSARKNLTGSQAVVRSDGNATWRSSVVNTFKLVFERNFRSK